MTNVCFFCKKTYDHDGVCMDFSLAPHTNYDYYKDGYCGCLSVEWVWKEDDNS